MTLASWPLEQLLEEYTSLLWKTCVKYLHPSHQSQACASFPKPFVFPSPPLVEVPEHVHSTNIQSLCLVKNENTTTLASVDEKGDCIVSYR